MKTKVIIACSGAGFIRRGLEVFTEELFKHLKEESAFSVILAAGGGTREPKRTVLPVLRRNTTIAKVIGRLTGKDPFEIQCFSFSLSLFIYLLTLRKYIVYTGEPVVYRCLCRWRRITGKKFTIVFFTGGQTVPGDFSASDVLHHVTPQTHSKASEYGPALQNQFTIPHFTGHSMNNYGKAESKRQLRLQLKLPADACIVLSVGALDRGVKRMDYVIAEFAELPAEKFFLVLVGEVETDTPSILKTANALLPQNNFRITTIAPDMVHDYYHAADVFVLASVKEGFGLVFLEALNAGLPVITHNYPVARYVLGGHGTLLNLERRGELSSFLLTANFPEEEGRTDERIAYVRQNFYWTVLRESYVRMFRSAGVERSRPGV